MTRRVLPAILGALAFEASPETSHPCDSSGKADASAGQTDRAVKIFARALQLDPTNANAARRLAVLVK